MSWNLTVATEENSPETWELTAETTTVNIILSVEEEAASTALAAAARAEEAKAETQALAGSALAIANASIQSKTESVAAKNLSENARDISIQKATEAGISEANSLANKNASIQAKTDAETAANTATNQAGIATQKASEAGTSEANSLANKNASIQAKTDSEAASAIAVTQAGIAATKASEAGISEANSLANKNASIQAKTDAESAATTATAQAVAATQKADQTALDATATAVDRAQTGQDRIATGQDKTASESAANLSTEQATLSSTARNEAEAAKIAAQNSEDNAFTSATATATSATNAATSESNALTYKNQAEGFKNNSQTILTDIEALLPNFPRPAVFALNKRAILNSAIFGQKLRPTNNFLKAFDYLNPSLVMVPSAYKAGQLFSVLPEGGAGDFTVSRNGTGTYLGSDGLLKTALANEPRLEFNTDGTFKGVLPEPAATNLLRRSEEFENSIWPKVNSPIVTPNSVISPNGIQNADTFTRTTSTAVIFQNVTQIIGTPYTYSIYLKCSTNGNVIFGTGSGAVFTSIPITTNWQRYTFTRTATATSDSLAIYLTSTTLQSVDIWGAQLEVGSVATSYIPTVASTLTRPADMITRTGIADLIGQTEGTVFIELNKQMNLLLERIFSIYSTSNPSFDNITLSKTIDNNIILGVRKNNTLSTYIFLGFTGIIKKIAFAYSKEINGIVLYLNGSQVILQTNSADFSSTLEEIYLGMLRPSITTANIFNGEFKSALIFKTRLTNAELATLTTL